MEPSVSKRAHNRQRWRERINAWQDSGLSQKAFCEAQQLNFASFRRWRRLFKAQAQPGVAADNEPVRFLPVKITEPAGSNLSLRFREDWRIEITAGFDAQLLGQVIRVLRTS